MDRDNPTIADESATHTPFWANPRILWALGALILGITLGFWGGRQSMRARRRLC